MDTKQQPRGRFAIDDDDTGTEQVPSGGVSSPRNITNHCQDITNTNEASKEASSPRLALAPASYVSGPRDMNRWREQNVPVSPEEGNNTEAIAYKGDDDGDTQPGVVPVHNSNHVQTSNPDDEGTVQVGVSLATSTAASPPSLQPTPEPGRQEGLVHAEVAPDLEKAVSDAVHQEKLRHQKECWKMTSLALLGCVVVLAVALICSLVFMLRNDGNEETEKASSIVVPTTLPIEHPTLNPTNAFTVSPTEDPSTNPTNTPSISPVEDPTLNPTPAPIFVPQDPQDCCGNPSLPGCTSKTTYLGCENVIEFNGNYYRTLHCHDPCDMIQECDNIGGELPSGWSIAPNGADTVYIGGSYAWGTQVVVFGPVGGPGAFRTTYTRTSLCLTCDTRGDYHVIETSPGFYERGNTCDLRILLIAS